MSVPGLGTNLDGASAIARDANGNLVSAGSAVRIFGGHRQLAVTRHTAAGALDLTFGTGGVVVLPIQGTDDVTVDAVVVQADHRVVVAGVHGPNPDSLHPFIARLTAAGQLDPTFGTNGVVHPDVSGSEIRDVAVDSSGNLVALTSGFDTLLNGPSYTVIRLLPDTGALDATFGVAGKSVVRSSGGPWNRLALAPNDSVLVVGGGSGNFFASRLTALGTLNLLFGDQGFVAGTDLVGRDIVVQPDGKIVIAGESAAADVAVLRLLSDGTHDPAFGTAGLVTVPTAAPDGAWAAALDSAGNVVVAGGTGPDATRTSLLARFGPDGTVDTTFGTDGRIVGGPGFAEIHDLTLAGDAPVVAGSYRENSLVAQYDSAGALAWRTIENLGKGGSDHGTVAVAQPDGRLLVAADQAFGDITLSRLLADGTLDPTFGQEGLVVIDRGPWTAGSAAGLVRQASGKIVVAVTWRDVSAGTTTGALMRFLANGTRDTTFGTAGSIVTDSGATPHDAAAALVQRATGLVLLGARGTGAARNQLLAAWSADGTPDATFGDAGVLVTDGGLSGDDQPVDLAVAPDGALLASSVAHDGASSARQIHRYTAVGALDPLFGSAGLVQDLTTGLRLAVQPDGRIVTAGANGNQFVLNRLTAAGALDTAFAGTGSASLVFENAQVVEADGIAITNGLPTVVGRADGVSAGGVLSPDSALAVARVVPDGRADMSFGGDGTATAFARGSRSVNIASALLDSAGRVLAVGSAFSTAPNGASDTFLARVLAPPSQPNVRGHIVDALGRIHGWGGTSLPADASTTYNHPGFARGLVTLPGGAGGYILDAAGGLVPFKIGAGPMPAAANTPDTYGNVDVARGVALLPSGKAGYVVDSAGGLHGFAVGTNELPPATTLSWYSGDSVRGLILLPGGTGGYVLDKNASLHPFKVGAGPMPPLAYTPETYGSADIARGVAFLPGGNSGYVLDSAGGLHPFAVGALPPSTTITWYRGNSVRGLMVLPDGTGGYVLDAAGRLNPFAVGTNPMPAWVYTPDVWSADMARGITTL